MKTPQQWLETVDFDWDEQVSVRMIEAIQQDAFESGRVAGLREAANKDKELASPYKSCTAGSFSESAEFHEYQILEATSTPPDNKKGGS